MPEISRFYGIMICINYNEHNPPHFHAYYGEYEASFKIGDLSILRGELPRKQRAMVLAWGMMYRDELIENWVRATQKISLQKIPSLED